MARLKKSKLPTTRKHTCDHCGQTWVEWRLSLDKYIVSGMLRLANNGGGPMRLLTDGFTKEEYTNLQRGSHWGLVERGDCDGRPLPRGWWQLTPTGWAFLRMETKLPRSAWTYKGKVLEFVGDEVSAADVFRDYVPPTWRPRRSA